MNTVIRHRFAVKVEQKAMLATISSKAGDRFILVNPFHAGLI
ncbi:MAG: hypothetical protein ABFS24_08550 [Pseudomonadota bacterium]